MGVILDFKLGKDHLSGHALEHIFRLADDDGSLNLVNAFTTASAFTVGELPGVFTTLAHVLPGVFTTFEHFLLHLLKLSPWDLTFRALDSHLSEEVFNHVLPGATLVTVTVASVTVTVVSPLAAMAGPLLLVLSSSTILVEDSDNHSGGLTLISDLEEGVIVTEVFFALGAEVKVLADGALVANAFDGGLTTTIALNRGVFDHRFLGLLVGIFTSFHLHELVEDTGDGFLELGLDKALNGMTGHIFGSSTTTFSFLSFLTLFTLSSGRRVLIFTDFGLDFDRLGLEIKWGNDRGHLGCGANLNFLGEGHLLDWLLNWLGLINDGLNRFNVLFNRLALSGNLFSLLHISRQFNVELELFVGGEGDSVSHLEVRVVFDLDLFVVRVDVGKVYLDSLVNSSFVADISGLLLEVLVGLNVGDSLNDGVIVVVKRNLDL